MANQLLKCFIAVSAGILLSACLSTPSTHFYVLEPLSEPPSSTAMTDQKRRIGIGPVSIPTLLGRKQIVTRTPDNGITIAEFHQWASPLKDNVAQVITHNLAALQADDLIRAYPWSAYGAVDYRVIIDIIRFDTQPEQSANLEANWAIMDEKKHTLLRQGHSKIERSLDDPSYPSSVKALSKILSDFSQELSSALGEIP